MFCFFCSRQDEYSRKNCAGITPKTQARIHGRIVVQERRKDTAIWTPNNPSFGTFCCDYKIWPNEGQGSPRSLPQERQCFLTTVFLPVRKICFEEILDKDPCSCEFCSVAATRFAEKRSPFSSWRSCIAGSRITRYVQEKFEQ